MCLQYRRGLSDPAGPTLAEKLINWLFSRRERSPQLPLHPYGFSFLVSIWGFFPSASLTGIAAEPFLSSLITEAKWEGKRDESECVRAGDVATAGASVCGAIPQEEERKNYAGKEGSKEGAVKLCKTI